MLAAVSLVAILSSDVATVRARTAPPAYRLRPRISRSRTPSICSIPASSAGIGRSDEQQAPNFQATRTPFSQSAATRPVTACGPPLFATLHRYRRGLIQPRRPLERRHLLPISATKRVVKIGHPVKPPVPGTGSGLRRSDHRFRALLCHLHGLCRFRSNTFDVDAG
jgi:hypothetical protein